MPKFYIEIHKPSGKITTKECPATVTNFSQAVEYEQKIIAKTADRNWTHIREK